MPTELYIIIGIVILLAIFAIVLKLIKRSKKPRYSYQKRDLFTRNELNFYNDLLPIARKMNLTVFAKVRIADLIEARKNSSPGSFAKVSQKHVDFVLCDASLTPVLVVELDDRSHDREDRKKRDAFVDHAMKSAKMPIIHVRDSKNLQKKISEQKATF